MTEHLRHHTHLPVLDSPFGGDWFGQRAEAFARIFGTPQFLILQTVLVAAWIAINAMGRATFDPFPFILLNLAFSLQAAYAAPLILLAQTRQADRDKANTDSDARHREDLARANFDMLLQNTSLTQEVAELTRRIDRLTEEIHRALIKKENA